MKQVYTYCIYQHWRQNSFNILIVKIEKRIDIKPGFTICIVDLSTLASEGRKKKNKSFFFFKYVIKNFGIT